MRKFLSDILVKASLGVEQNAYVLGTVGIGTSTPSYKLHVAGDAYVSSNFTIGSTTNIAAAAWLQFNGSNVLLGEGTNTYLQANGGGSIIFRNNSPSELMRITNSGNVGIGTTSPATSVEIARQNSSLNDNIPTIRLTDLDTSSASGQITGRVEFYTSDGTPGPAGVTSYIASNTESTSGLGALSFGTGQSGSATERMRITSSGNVGIGTSSPSYKLDVAGSIRTQDGYIIGANGNADITIDGNIGSQLRYGTQKILLNSADAYIYTNNIARVFVNNAGNVGIGTTSPNSWAQLETTGTVAIGGILYIKSSQKIQGLTGFPGSAGNLSINPDGGNVGIGTTSPGYKLEVNGSARVANTLWVNNSNGNAVVNAYSGGQIGTYLAKASSATANFTTTGVSYPRGLGFGAIIGQGNTTDIPVNNASWNGGYGGNIGFWSDVHYGVEGGTNSIGFNAVIKGSGNSNSYGFFSDLSGATDGVRYGIYTKGEQQNYFSGNVGIGTSSPEYKLDVSGVARINRTGSGGDVLIVLGPNGYANNIFLGVPGTTSEGLRLTYNSTDGSSEINNIYNAPLYFKTNATTRLTIANSGAATFSSSVTASNLYLGSLTNEQLMISGTGSRGIGVSTTTSGDPYVRLYDNTTIKADIWWGRSGNYMGINSVGINTAINPYGGNVGIGTASPNTWKLSVDSSTIYAASFDTSNNVGVVINGNDTTASQIIGFSESASTYNALHLRTNSTSTSGLYINTSGNVGIGTTSPQTGVKLDVYGATAIAGGSEGLRIGNVGDNAAYDNIKIYYTGYNGGAPRVYMTPRTTPGSGVVNTFFHLQNTNGTSTTSNNTMGLIVDGNVGIGTTSTPDQLSVGKSTGTSVSITSNSAAGTNGSPLNLDINFRGYGDNKMAMIRSWDESASTGNGYLTFSTNYYNGSSNVFTEKMRIGPTGNVGIGTTSPSSKLEVSVAPSAAWMNLINANEPAFRLTAFNNGTNNGSSTYAFKHGLYYGTTENATITFYRGGSSVGGFLTFTTDNGNERMRIDASGNVGIGTTSPTSALHIGQDRSLRVEGSSSANDNYGISMGGSGAFTIDSPGTYAGRFIINNAGNVGIGTTTPTSKLDVWGDLSIANSGYYSAAYDWNFSQSSSNGRLAIAYYGSEKVSVLDNGNVGIGINSPAQKLDIDGNISLGSWTKPGSTYVGLRRADDGSFGGGGDSGLVIESYNHASPYTGDYSQRVHLRTHLYNGGSHNVLTAYGLNVGIGTTTPNAKLEVVGNTYLRGGALYVDTIAGYTGNVVNLQSATNLVLPSGNVGIRVTNPTVSLSIGASAYDGNPLTGLQYAQVTGGGRLDLMVQTWGTGSDYGLTTGLSVVTPGFDTKDVRVGIGTTSPGAKLEVTANPGGTTMLLGRASGNSSIKALNDNGGYLALDSTGGATIINHYSSDNIWMVTGGGNVGVGTSSPTHKLHVAGSVLIDNYLYLDSNEIWAKSGGDLFVKADNKVYIQPAASTTAVFDTNGNVGIGTTSPQRLLHVNNPNTGAGADGSIKISNATVGSGTLDGADLTMNTSGEFYITNRENGPTIFETNGAERMRITSGGNVGIGTPSPGATLDVNGALSNGRSIIRVTNSDTANYVTVGAGIPGISNAGMNFALDGTSKMVISSGGNVGIGVTSPGVRLDVSGDIRASNVLYGSSAFVNLIRMNGGTELQFRNSTNVEVVRITSGGNVGIGTTSPSFRLDVRTGGQGDIASFRGSAYPITFATTGSVGNYYGTQMMMAADAGSTQAAFRINTRYNSAAGSGVAFTIESSTNDQSYGQNPSDLTYSEKFRIAANGNVGIGTISPSEKLEVNGSIRLSDGNADGPQLKLASSGYSDWNIDNYNGSLRAYYGSTEYTRLTSSGYFGIGTSSPSYKLHVEGNVSGISIYASHDIAAFSDITVKKDVEKIENAVDKVKELNGYTYVRTDDATGTRRAGVIAQEVQKVLPEVVSQNPDGTLNVAYANMIALLIEGMKEQQATIERMQQEINELKK